MTTWRTINIDCQNEDCLHKWDDLVELEKQDESFICPSCGDLSGKRNPYRSFNFLSTERHVGKTEFLKDRTRQEAIEANKVKTEMLNLPHEKRTEHKKAIKKLTGEKV